MYIKRAIETYLEKTSSQFKTILLTGPRQVGKSTLLKKLFKDIKYVTLDDPFLEEQARNNGDMFIMLNQPPVIIDEVQYAPELFRYIKINCDNSNKNGLFYLTGSQRFELMRDVSESLAGRVVTMELSGLSLREIQQDSFNERFKPTMEYILERQKTVKKPKNIWEIIHRGSYPELQKENVDWSNFYASYLNTYISRDVRKLTAVKDETAFRKFMIACAARTGEVINYSNIAIEIGKEVNTVKNWISILETSGIIYILEPFYSTTLKKAIKTPKLYFRDTGLVCYLTRWLTAESLAYGAQSGNIFETFAISEILKSYSNSGHDYKNYVFFYRGRDKKKTSMDGIVTETEGEIDFIIEEDGILYPVEIKQSSNVSADQTSTFMVLDKIDGKKRGMGAIICNIPQPGKIRENVLSIPIWYI